MSEPTGKERICRACGQDCTGQPRIKDPKGRYLHKACYEKAKARALQKKRERETAAVADDAFALDDGGVGADAGMFAEIEAPPAVSASCPSCGRALPGGAVLCTGCGHNLSAGMSQTKVMAREKRAETSKGAALAGASWVLALVGACVGGLLAIIAWTVKVNLTQREYYFALLGVGFLVGGGAALLAGNRKGVMSGMIAACVALVATPLAIVTAYSVFLEESFSSDIEAQSATWAESWMTDLEAKSLMADSRAFRAERAGEMLDWPSGQSYETAYEFLQYPASITGPVRDEWDAMNPAARERKKDEIVAEREITALADLWALQKLEAGEALAWPEGMDYDTAFVIEDYPPDLVESARTYWEGLSRTEQVAHVTESYERFGAAMSSPEVTMALMESEFETSDFLWYGAMTVLSVITAFGVGSGMSADEAGA